MVKTFVDLHLHSNKSDGKLTPSQVADCLAKNNIALAALTDHDTTAGSDEFKQKAEGLGIKVISGVEISAEQDDIGIHILGYGINVKDTRLIKFLVKQIAERKKAFEKYVALFKKAGFIINQKKYKELKKIPSVAKTHVFELIWSLPENKKLSFKKYKLEKHQKIQRVFINSFMTLPGQIAHVRKKSIEAKLAIDLIHGAGGIAVWAHPGLEIEFKKAGAFKQVFKNLAAHGIDGLEAFSKAESHMPKWTARLCNLAKKHNLLATIGSDDHDGSRMGTLKVGDQFYLELFQRLSGKMGFQ